MSRAAIRRRITVIANLIRPAHSLEARLEKLTPDQRSTYCRWRICMNQWQSEHPDGQAYQQLIDGGLGPTLRRDVFEALFGRRVMIPANVAEQEIAEMYHRMVSQG